VTRASGRRFAHGGNDGKTDLFHGDALWREDGGAARGRRTGQGRLRRALDDPARKSALEAILADLKTLLN
jgi:hypothetical protein